MAYFDEDAADVACNFFERLLKHTGDYHGQPFLLAPWEEDATRTIFGSFNDDGSQLIKLGYLEVPKKSGKTEWCAGIVILALMMAKNPGCQVYGAAAATKQALNVYRAACKMVEQQPLLSKRLRILRGTNRIIKRSDPDSFYAAIAADGDFSDGMNPSVVIADEVHRWRTRKQLENWDVLTKSGITRKDRLAIAITTAGVRSESPLAWRLHEKTEKVLKGTAPDPTFYGRIYAADPADDWTSEETWRKANPSLKDNGGFLDISKLREVYDASLSDPEEQRAFRRYFLNLWDEKENRAIDMGQWDACPLDWEAVGLLPKEMDRPVRSFPHEFLKKFVGRRCFPGVDLSLSTDMSAITLVFPRDDGGYDFLPFYYMPRGVSGSKYDIRRREVRDGNPYRQWADRGFIELHEGNAINYLEIRARLLWAAEMFDVSELCFDPYNSGEMQEGLNVEGYTCVPVRQGAPTLNEATKKFLSLVATGEVHHGGHPVLRLNASCLCTESKNDLVKPIKPNRERETARIDGIAAAITAMTRAIVAVEDPTAGFYKNGLTVI